MKKLWDFICENNECSFVEEFLVSKEEEAGSFVCPECESKMFRSISGGKIAFFDQQKHQMFLKNRSREHTQKAMREGRPLTENESGICSDPVWRNKTRAKNTSRTTLSQNKNAHLL